jgi:putative acetyltransferase
MAKIEIRQYRATDRDRIIDLFRGSVRQVARRDYSPAQIAAWAPDDIDAEGFGRRSADRPTCVAAIDGDLAGFGDLAPDGHIDMLYVHANHQRKGIARSLLDKIESVARQQGVRRVYAEASITARPVFETHGFQVLAVQTVSLRGQTFTNYPVEKHLGASISRKRGTIDR